MFRVRKGLSLTLALLIGLLVGCGGKTTASGEKVTINFWHAMSYESAHGKTLQSLVQKYNASQDKVFVKEEYMGSYGDLGTKITAAVAAKTPPAVVQVTDSLLSTLVRSEALLDLTKKISNSDRNDYPASLFEPLTFDNKIYGLPFNKALIVLIYDKQAVPNPPTTWAEFEQVSKAVTIPGQRTGTAFEANAFYFGTFFVQAGGEWTNKDRTQALFNSDAGVKALELIVKMNSEGTATQLKPREYQSNYFNEGRAAMIATTSASFAFINPANKNEWGVAQLYKGPTNDKTGVSGANVAILQSAKPEEQEAAMKFMLWLTGKTGTLEWATAKTGYMPVRKSAVETKEWKDFVRANPEYEVLGLSMEKGTTHPNHVQWGSVQNLITTAVEEALLKRATPKEALDKAAKAATELLNKK